MATEQAEFRPGRLTTEQIFSLRLLAENYFGNARWCVVPCFH